MDVDVDVDVDVGEVVDVGGVELELTMVLLLALVAELELPLLPASKTTMFAFLPGGTVTTQNAAPPAPSELSLEVTSFNPLTEGSILQGRPLQPASSSQVISTPKVAGVSRNGVVAS